MVDVYSVHLASKCAWIRRLINNTKGKWKEAMWVMLNTNKVILNKNINFRVQEWGLTEFHQQLLNAWFAVTSTTPNTTQEIANQFIIYNYHIKINGKKLTENFSPSPILKNLKMLDLIDNDGSIISRDSMSQLLGQDLNYLKYVSLKSAIPKQWKKLLKMEIKSINKEEIAISDEPYIKINNNMKPITKTTNKELYLKQISKYTKEATALETWINLYPFLEKQDWKVLYKLPYKITTEPYLQSFQYKIMNRILNCRNKLFTWNIIKNDKCEYCHNIDTIFHHLYLYPQSKYMWNHLRKWLDNNLEINMHFTECEVVFGLPYSNSVEVKIMNYLIILLKWFINNTKNEEKPLYFVNFLSLLKEKNNCMTYYNVINEHVLKDWQEKLCSVL